MAESDAPKIIVDSDWKSQARAEKEKLAAQERQRAADKPVPAPGQPAQPGQPGADARSQGQRLPPADFGTLLGTLITQALMYMGGFPDEQGRAMVSLEHARFHIDLISTLGEKTKGNLTPQEEQDLQQALSELRLRFVEITKAVAQMAEERAAKAAKGGPGGPIPGMPGKMG